MSKRYIPIQRRHFARRAMLSPGGVLLCFLIFLSLVSLTTMVQAGFNGSPLSTFTNHIVHAQDQIVDSVNATQASNDVVFVNPTPVANNNSIKVATNISAKLLNLPFEKNWPVRGHITTYFSRYHLGIDIATFRGTPIHPFASGVVKEAGWFGGNSFGNAIVIAHTDGWETLYGHLDKIFVQVGQEVNLASVIGAVGSTGNSTGPHLHFQLTKDGRYLNPLSYLP